MRQPIFSRSGILFIALLLDSLFLIWLYFPGYNSYPDFFDSLAVLKRDGWHAVFPAWLLGIFYSLFGKHTFYLYIGNIVVFHAALFLILLAVLRHSKMLAFFILLCVPTANLYLLNVFSWSTQNLANGLLLLYAFVLYFVLTPPSNKIRFIFWGAFVLIYCACLLWRHSAIFAVFPALFLPLFYWAQQNKKTFAKLLVVAAVGSIVVAVLIPKLLQEGEKTYPANHIFLHQMAGACVPADDSACFPKEWFAKNRNFEDVKAIYDYFPLFADPLTHPIYLLDSQGLAYSAFKIKKLHHGVHLENLYTLWFRAITQHPQHFLAHQWRFFKGFWLNDFSINIHNADSLYFYQNTRYDSFAVQMVLNSKNLNLFPVAERFIHFSPLRLQIYQTLVEHLPFFDRTAMGVVTLLGLVISTLLLLRTNATPILFFTWCVFLACFVYAFVLTIFSPVPDFRYLAPVFALNWLGIISALITLYLHIQQKNKKSWR